MQLLISKCSQANGKWTNQFTRNWALGMGHWALVLSVAVGAASRREVWGIGQTGQFNFGFWIDDFGLNFNSLI
ncbi:hypothetical protein [Nostoc sp.]